MYLGDTRWKQFLVLQQCWPVNHIAGGGWGCGRGGMGILWNFNLTWLCEIRLVFASLYLACHLNVNVARLTVEPYHSDCLSDRCLLAIFCSQVVAHFHSEQSDIFARVCGATVSALGHAEGCWFEPPLGLKLIVPFSLSILTVMLFWWFSA